MLPSQQAKFNPSSLLPDVSQMPIKRGRGRPRKHPISDNSRASSLSSSRGSSPQVNGKDSVCYFHCFFWSSVLLMFSNLQRSQTPRSAGPSRLVSMTPTPTPNQIFPPGSGSSAATYSLNQSGTPAPYTGVRNPSSFTPSQSSKFPHPSTLINSSAPFQTAQTEL